MALLLYLDMNSNDFAFIKKVIFIENKAFFIKKGEQRVQVHKLYRAYGMGRVDTSRSIK